MAKLYAKAPDGSDALLSIVITGFTQSLQQNGWCKLPNGLLIQWQTATKLKNESYTLNFPISFNSDIYYIAYSFNTEIYDHIYFFSIYKNNNTSFNIGFRELRYSITIKIFSLGI